MICSYSLKKRIQTPLWAFGYIPPGVLPCALDDPVSQQSLADHASTGSGYTAKTQRASDDKDPLPDINDMIAISRSGLVKAYAVVIVIAMCKFWKMRLL